MLAAECWPTSARRLERTARKMTAATPKQAPKVIAAMVDGCMVDDEAGADGCTTFPSVTALFAGVGEGGTSGTAEAVAVAPGAVDTKEDTEMALVESG